MTTATQNHAVENAQAWYETILDQLSRLKAGCRQSNEAYETVRQEILESPLEIAVRSSWQTLGADLKPAEFYILLSTGGPALRIRGELGHLFNCPENCRLEYQDWRTSWQEFSGADSAILDSYAAQFCFGD
jgi:hypothetical protein